MKIKSLLFALLIIILSLQIINAQTNIYHPFPDSKAEWSWSSCSLCWPPPCWYCWCGLYFLNADTIINSNIYKKLYSASDSTLSNGSYEGAIREDSSKKIYYWEGVLQTKSYSIISL